MSRTYDEANPLNALQGVVADAQAGVFSGFDMIIHALLHDDREVRLDAAYCCKRIGFSAALDPLCRMAHSDSASENRAQAIYGLGGIGRPSAIPAIVRALGDEEDECREAARTVLYRMVGADVLPLVGDEGDELDPAEPARVGQWWAAHSQRFDSARVYAMGELAGPHVFIRRIKETATPLPDAYLNLLRDWTGQDFGEAPLPRVIEQWENWWVRNKLSYEPGRRYFFGHRVP